MLYLDTSALLKLYLLEEGSEWVHREVVHQQDPLPVWEIQEAELINAFRLKVFRGELSVEQADEQLLLFQSRKARGQIQFPYLDRCSLMERFRLLSLHTPELGCRTMDILHVACAVELNVDRFLTFDLRQQSLAQKAGLPVDRYSEGNH